MGVSLWSSGTQLAVVTTEHSLSGANGVNLEGEYQLVVDLVNMVAGDVVELRAYQIALTGGTKRGVYFAAYYGAQPTHAVMVATDRLLNDLTDTNSLEFTLTQTFGTGRNFPYKVLVHRSMAPTVAARTLDVTTTGAGGVDWGNVENQATAVNLSSTNIDPDQVVASVTGAVGSVAAGGITAASIATGAVDADALAADAVTEIQAGLSTLDAAGVRTAVGLAAANLDTQLTAIDDFLDTEIAAILAAVDTEIVAIITTLGVAGAGLTAMPAGTLTAGERTAIANAYLDLANGIETGFTPRQTHRIMAAVLAGKVSGYAAGPGVFRSMDDSANRVSATHDANGNRTAMTLTP